MLRKKSRKNADKVCTKKNKIKHGSFFIALYHFKSLIPALARDII